MSTDRKEIEVAPVLKASAEREELRVPCQPLEDVLLLKDESVLLDVEPSLRDDLEGVGLPRVRVLDEEDLPKVA